MNTLIHPLLFQGQVVLSEILSFASTSSSSRLVHQPPLKFTQTIPQAFASSVNQQGEPPERRTL
ncbi:MAG: hypothetical protein IKN82_08220 [Treponema sp.]|nr:hypothetical protein [Treponema sp.]